MNCSTPDRLNIGLHCQTMKRADGLVAGSEITTLGLKRAFEKHPDVDRVFRFGSDFVGLSESDNLDLLIVEGWHESLPRSIQRIRADHPGVTVFFWNLSFFGFQHVIKLDVDGYLSNSRKVAVLLGHIAPTRFVMLAADPDIFQPVDIDPRYMHEITYLGMCHPRKSSDILDRILFEAADYDLAIYGTGWDDHPLFKRFWKGRLPIEDMAKLYSSSGIVLGMTEDRQRKTGMINNRVFEALSCGACFLCEYFPELEAVFGDHILYSRRTGDTVRILDELIKYPSRRNTMGEVGRDLIRRHHTYHHRVNEILAFYRSVMS